MRCDKCGTESATGRKFCAVCGSHISKPCPACARKTSLRRRFVKTAARPWTHPPLVAKPPQSDASLKYKAEAPAADRLEGERKIVTALFADLRGSTTLMEELDPEAVHAIVAPLLRIMTELEQRYILL